MRQAAVVPSEGISILVVDDDAAVADATAMLLGSLGYRPIVAKNTEQAVRGIAECREPPSLMICDYRLGADENGVDAICDIRECAGMQLPAILIGGDTFSAIADPLSGIEDCRLLDKPVNVDDLLELIEHATRANIH